MGFDISGLNPKNKKGEYFRNNVWYWRPLAEYVLKETKVIDEKDQDSWHYNDCHEVPKEQAEQIAKQLDHLIKSGHCRTFARSWEIRREKIEKHNKKVMKELDKFEKDVQRRMNDSSLAPKDYPKEDHDKWEKIYEKRNSDGSYPFEEENVKEFSEFCKNSGGFTIG